MSEKPLCDLCGGQMAPHAHFVVRIDVFADPSIPPTTASELAATDFRKLYAELLKQMEDMTEEQLQDLVFRRFEFAICPKCHPKLLANPLGRPRHSRTNEN